MPEATMLKTSDFDFALPQELIAQTPIEPRDASRLMTLDRRTGRVGHGQFRDILELLTPKDCLILNDSRVLPARIFGTKTGNGPAGDPACPGGAVSPETGAPGGVVSPETGAPGGNVEFLLLENKGDDTWEALCKPGRRAKEGSCFQFGGGLLRGRVTEVKEDGSRMVRFEYEGEFYSLLEQIGQMPLPPYIKEKLRDSERYQTVYSRQAGSAAAPTAGLHFTKELLCQLREKGVEQGFVTLHVGLGTFRPVSAENILEHKMHTEHYHLPAQTADLINRTRARGGRVIAVGTTSCRAIESAARAPGFTGEFSEAEGYTGIFLYPGCEFLGIDGLITNFHLPKSTLIMLVSALAGREHVLAAYAQAVQRGYRFFSFGDAMFVGDLK